MVVFSIGIKIEASQDEVIEQNFLQISDASVNIYIVFEG